MKTYYLEPSLYVNQKSFYKKAKVNELDCGAKELISYKTKVCMITKGGNFIRLWKGYSLTTKNHINEFRVQNGLEPINKEEWMKLKVKNTGGRKLFKVIEWDKKTNSMSKESYFEKGQEHQIVNLIWKNIREHEPNALFYFNWRSVLQDLKTMDDSESFTKTGIQVTLERR